jgi:hypothetical protein
MALNAYPHSDVAMSGESIMISLLAAIAMVQAPDPAGRYQLDGAPQCILRLQDSLPGLPDSLIQGDSRSGFAFASPGCPFGLEALSLWRFADETQTLSLVDGAGEALLSARLSDDVWVARHSSGEGVRLVRD